MGALNPVERIEAKRKGDPYRRGVKWWKIKDRAYSQTDDGRRELFNSDWRAIPQTARPA